MATSYRKPYPVIRRQNGYYRTDGDGSWVPAIEPPPVDVMCTIAPARSIDYQKMQALSSGQIWTDLIRVNSDERMETVREGDDGHPGDIIIWEGRRYLIVNEARHTILGTSVSHHRYLAQREISKAPGEQPA